MDKEDTVQGEAMYERHRNPFIIVNQFTCAYIIVKEQNIKMVINLMTK